MGRSSSTDKSSQKDAGMAYGLLLILLGFFFKDWNYFGAAGALLFVTMASPKLLKYPAIIWFKGSEILGSLTSKILLTLIFYFIISPVAVVLKVLGKDHLKLTGHDSASAFIDRRKLIQAQDLKDPF